MLRKELENMIDYYEKRIKYLIDEIPEDYFEEEQSKNMLKEFIQSKEQNIIKFLISEESILLLFSFEIKSAEKEEDFIKELTDEVCREIKEGEKRVYMLAVAKNIKEKNLLSKVLRGQKRKICSQIHRNTQDVFADIIFVPKINTQSIEINVSRMNSLWYPEPSLKVNILGDDEEWENSIRGYVYVARLCDLVDIYDQVGDMLFSYNLRYGIQDKLNLENSMRVTLKEEPEMFWFYNNGITIVTNNDNIKLEESSKIVLCDSWKIDALNFSVINGAQTISTASRIFSDTTLSEDEKKKAKVLLRVIIANEESAKRKITIALNRQKPIKTEDIAFQSAFIHSFNEYMDGREETNNTYLHIIKRGEEVYDKGTINLTTFAQLVYTCFMNPTDARNRGPAKLFYEGKVEGDLYDKYFKKEFVENEKKRDNIFEQYYKEIIWAHKLMQEYDDKLDSNYSKGSGEKVILANNKWSFIAYILKCIQGFMEDISSDSIDYTDFEENNDVVKNIRKYMDAFVQLVQSVCPDGYDITISKKKTLWEKLLKAKELPEVFEKLRDAEEKVEGDL